MHLSLNSSQGKLHHLLREGNEVWVLYLDVINFQTIEIQYGYKVCAKIIEEIANVIHETLGKQDRIFLHTHLESRGGDDFVVYFVPDHSTPWPIVDVAKNWVLPLEELLNRRVNKIINDKIKLRSGLVLCEKESGCNIDYLLDAAVKEALLLNKSEPEPLYFAKREEIKRLLKQPNALLKTAFQPIVQVQTGNIFGFEALSRFAEKTPFGSIAELFPFAEKIGQLYPIETICRRQAIQSFPSIMAPGELLFLNINPQVLLDPEFASGQTRRLLAERGLKPNRVVLEITERSAIEDFTTFREALEHYRSQGFLIALDDVGAGYSSLQSIAELHPDFLKVDRSLISGVNRDPIKWALLETFVTFTKRIGCQMVAEGVETLEEMQTVMRLGADYVQGYFVGCPEFTRQGIHEQARKMFGNKQMNKVNRDHTILSLIEPLALFDIETLVSAVDEYFRNQPNVWLAGITDGNRVVGAIQRDKLYAALGTRYGISLFANRKISMLMDDRPLIVEDATPVEVVSSLAMQRSNTQLYDGIIVVNQQKPVGMVSVAMLIKTMADRQIQIAQGANPLTGLPGNILIDQELLQRLELCREFAVIYADLNKFKRYNDLYGFRQGDLAIKHLGEVLVDTAREFDKEAFVGHIGGDDFIVVMQNKLLEACCQEIIARFSKRTQNGLNKENLTVGLAGLDFKDQLGTITPLILAEYAAQVKKEVKDQNGNAYIIRSVQLSNKEMTLYA